jgi:hypothetical protein
MASSEADVKTGERWTHGAIRACACWMVGQSGTQVIVLAGVVELTMSSQTANAALLHSEELFALGVEFSVSKSPAKVAG